MRATRPGSWPTRRRRSKRRRGWRGFSFTDGSTGALDVDITDSTAAGNVIYSSTAAGASTLDINGFSTGATNNFLYTTSGDGGLAVTMTDVTAGQNVSFQSGGSGASSLTQTNVDISGAFDYDVTGTGDLTVNMTNVTGSGDLNLDVTGAGDGSVTATDFDNGGNGLIAAGSSTGDVSLSVTDSGGTNAFNAVTVTQTGTGGASGTFDNVTATSGVTLTSASSSASNLSVTDGSYGGAIALTETGSGSATATLTNVTTTAGGVTVSESGDGAATLTATGGSYAGGVTFDSAGAGVANASVNGGTYGGDIDLEADNTDAFFATLQNNIDAGANNFIINADNTGLLTASVSRSNAANGSLLVDAANTVTDASITLTGGGFNDGVTVNANNTGTITYAMTGMNFDTAAAGAAVDLNFGSAITSGSANVNNNTFTTVDGVAFDAAFDGGTINFALTNNVLTNQSGGSQSALVGASGTATLNSTVTGNTFTNLDAAATASEFEIATIAGNPTINLNLSGNTAVNGGGGAGSGELLVRESAGTVAVFELTDTFNNTGTRNDATVTFDPNNIGDFDDLANPPATP